MQHHNRAAVQVRLSFRRSSLLLKGALIAAIVLSMAALLALTGVRTRLQTENAALKAQAAALEEENQQLEENIDALGTVQSVERIAREELGLVDPDTILFEIGN